MYGYALLHSHQASGRNRLATAFASYIYQLCKSNERLTRQDRYGGTQNIIILPQHLTQKCERQNYANKRAKSSNYRKR